jgi:hypothetical protein
VSRDTHGAKGRSLLNNEVEINGGLNDDPAAVGSHIHTSPSHDSVHSHSSGAGQETAAPPREICFHVKEAWNIFEVSGRPILRCIHFQSKR